MRLLPKLTTKLLEPDFLIKFKALMFSQFDKFKANYKKHYDDPEKNPIMTESDAEGFTYFKKIFSLIIISGGATWFISKFGVKFLTPKVTKKEVEESDKLRRALIATHTPVQRKLWEEIQRSQKDKDSILSLMIDSIFNESNSSRVKYTDLISTIFLSKKSREIQSATKWINIQVRKYEDSLSHNQLVIYKNLYETDLKIASKANIVKSIFYIGVPILIYRLLAFGVSKDMKAWEKAIKS
jgi:hypothetical protein